MNIHNIWHHPSLTYAFKIFSSSQAMVVITTSFSSPHQPVVHPVDSRLGVNQALMIRRGSERISQGIDLQAVRTTQKTILQM